MGNYTPLAELLTVDEFVSYLNELNIDLPLEIGIDDDSDPMAEPVSVSGQVIGNRWAILPMEGWDADLDGNPTDSSIQRWRAFGRSGAKLIWGESAAVRPDGRSSPEQLVVAPETQQGLESLVAETKSAHAERFGGSDDLKVGIQLTHSGRFCRPAPSGSAAPVAVRHHPHFDKLLGPPPDSELLSDVELRDLARDYVSSVSVAAVAGFDFVDLKACHGFLSHELLGAYDRPGDFGGSFENRTRFLRSIIEGVHEEAPEVELSLRLSAFDTVAYVMGDRGVGRPLSDDPARYWFGTDESGHEIDLDEPIRLLKEMRDLGVSLFCITGSSHYNAWHLQRPALTAKSGEYSTPEDPLVGVARHIAVTSELKRAVGGITVVGSGYSYLQQWLPHVARATVRAGKTDMVGVARMHLAYPEMIVDAMSGSTFDLEAVEGRF